MRLTSPSIFTVPFLSSTTLAERCTPAEISRFIPSNAAVTFAQPVQSNGTFHVPAGDVAYPTSPTNLRELCAVQINVTSSPTSAYSFGLFLPSEWNQRFL